MKFIERTQYNNVITVKIMIPSGCNAHCCFCYLNDPKVKLEFDRKRFLDNLPASIERIITAIGDKNKISIDITGNEPTFDVELLAKTLDILREMNIKDKVERVTITTNGYHLLECSPYFKGVIDYVNISVHDFRADEREAIMRCHPISDEQYGEMVSTLKNLGITCSVTSVIHKKINNFIRWRDEFVEWAKHQGFIGIRFRCDVFWNESDKFDAYMNASMCDGQFKIITYENTPDSHWCRLRRYDGFRVFFLHGVRDTSEVVKGIEYVIDDDGLIYCDFYKRTPIDKYEYEIGKIYDSMGGDD